MIEETGRDALTEMRRLLGVLRRDGGRPDWSPSRAGAARALVERHASAGWTSSSRRRASARLPPGVDLTAYRVIEDAPGRPPSTAAHQADVLVRYATSRSSRATTATVEPRRLLGCAPRGLYGGHLGADA